MRTPDSTPSRLCLPSAPLFVLTFLGILGGVVGGSSGCAIGGGGGGGSFQLKSLPRAKTVERNEEIWSGRLGPEQYRVMRQGGTELAFSGAYWNHHASGDYRCAACGQVLYHSSAKFDSGTGRPSFTGPARPKAIDTHKAPGFGGARVDVSCSRCKSHIGFVYDNGPAPSGLRHSLNSIALAFETRAEAARRRHRERRYR